MVGKGEILKGQAWGEHGSGNKCATVKFGAQTFSAEGAAAGCIVHKAEQKRR